MCAQCMASAATIAAGATGLRAWLAAARLRWVTPQRLKWATGALMTVAVVLAGVGIGSPQ